VCCSVLQSVVKFGRVLQCVAVRRSVSNTTLTSCGIPPTVCYIVLQCVAVCCRVLQCVTKCGSVLQCAAVHRSASHIDALRPTPAVLCSVLHYFASSCSVL